MPTTTLDANNKSASCALSGGSLVATFSASSANVASTRVISEPTYFEVTATTLNNVMAVGFANRAFSFAGATLLGGDNNGLAYKQNGTVVLNGTTLTTIQTFTQGNVIQCAIRPAERTVFFNVGNGNWNNSAANSPTTNTGGIDYSSMNLAALLLGIGATFSASSQVATVAFSSSGWSFSAPSGFSSVDVNGASGVGAMKAGATPVLVGPVLKNPVTTTAQRCTLPIATGANYGISGNTPNTVVKFWTPAAAATHISGTVTESGSPVARIVRIFDHNTGEFLGETKSSAVDGTYSIPALGRTSVLAIAYDPTSFNAIGYDIVTPV